MIINLEKIAQETLKIPVSKVVLEEKLAMIFSYGVFIGKLPYTGHLSRIEFDTSPGEVNRLDWYKIFDHVAPHIQPAIESHLKRTDVQLTPHLFRKAAPHIKESVEETVRYRQVGLFDCYYEAEMWHVRPEGHFPEV